MASKRDLKKLVDGIVFEIVEESFDIKEFNPKKEEECEKCIEEAADFYDEVRSDINAAKSKKDFPVIREKIDKARIEFTKKLNKLN